MKKKNLNTGKHARKLKRGKPVRVQRLVGLTHGDCCRIAQAIGMSLGEYEGREDDSRGLAFTVCGGKTVDGREEPWIARMNGWPVEDIADEAIRKNAVKKIGRWSWELIQPNVES